jgi:hypothetical protein
MKLEEGLAIRLSLSGRRRGLTIVYQTGSQVREGLQIWVTIPPGYESA